MRKLIIIALGLSFTSPLFAEILSVSSAYNLEDPHKGVSVIGGVSAGDVDLIGAKINVPVADNFQVFGDLGLVDTVFDRDGELTFGVGALFKLPVNSPVPVGIKGSYHFLPADEFDFTEIAARGVVSGQIPDVANWTWFAEAGIHWWDLEFDSRRLRGAETDDTEFGLEAGVQYQATDQFGAFGSFELVDESWVNLGIRWNF